MADVGETNVATSVGRWQVRDTIVERHGARYAMTYWFQSNHRRRPMNSRRASVCSVMRSSGDARTRAGAVDLAGPGRRGGRTGRAHIVCDPPHPGSQLAISITGTVRLKADTSKLRSTAQP
jgi:hypothetical protein